MPKTNLLPRRQFLAATGIAAVVDLLQGQLQAADNAAGAAAGRVRHSVCKWCYPKIALEDLAIAAKEIGLESIELLDPPDFPALKKHGLHCAMVSFPTAIAPDGTKIGPIPKGFNRVEHHDLLISVYEPLLKASAEAGFKQVICFSGNRDGLDDEQGLKNCAIGLKRLMPLCEQLGVTLCMELLNSKVNHPDYMCDNSVWGVELVKRVGSDNFKLLYDIYHMQIMEGDVIRTIRENHKYYGHYHTAGNPGRNELDDSQELFYPAIAKAIADTGYDGYFAHEFIAKRDPIAGLTDAVRQCTV